jgi:hypothetical protein
MGLRERGFGGMGWIHLAEERSQWSMAVKLHVP